MYIIQLAYRRMQLSAEDTEHLLSISAASIRDFSLNHRASVHRNFHQVNRHVAEYSESQSLKREKRFTIKSSSHADPLSQNVFDRIKFPKERINRDKMNMNLSLFLSLSLSLSPFPLSI